MINTGLIFKEADPQAYKLGGLGGLPKIIINPDRNWLYYPSIFEPQYIRFETSNCTGFNTNEQIEMYLRVRFGVDENYSDRATGVFAGTYPPGNDPHYVYESIRKNGLVSESILPFSEDLKTVGEYYSFKGADEKKIREEGLKWLEKWDFKHEYVFQQNDTDKAKKLYEALLYSPISASVTAWTGKKAGIYTKVKGGIDNHWTVLVVGAEYGKHWIVKDTYLEDGQPIKFLAWDYDFNIAKRIHIDTKKSVELKISIITKLIALYKEWMGLLPKEGIAEPESVLPQPEPITVPVKYGWDTKEKARKSVRMICDEEGLSLKDKNLITAVIDCESGFNPKAVNQNSDARKSVDYGIAQLNSYWYIEKMKLVTKDQALNDPEFCIRLVIKRFKAGFLKDWVCYSKGYYKKHL